MKCQCGYEYVTGYEPNNNANPFPVIKGDEEFLVIDPAASVWGSRNKRRGELRACPKCGLVYFVEVL